MFLRRSLCLAIATAIAWIIPSSRVTCGDDYLGSVKPLLRSKCVSCHGGLKQSGGLRLDTGRLALDGGDSGGAVVPGDEAASLLWQRVTSQDKDERMPPDAEPLTAAELQLIKQWIRAGARAPDNEVPQTDPQHHWAFKPLQQEAAPIRHGLQPLDAFIVDRLEKVGLTLAPRADPQTLIRRLFCDVTGLPPQWQSLQSWTRRLNCDEREIDQLIDTLLASPRHGERFAQHWLDVVRYADTHGFEVNTPRPNAWPYRDYVIRAINADKPYNRFAAEQIAGDQFSEDAATGFMVAAAVLLPGQIGQDDASKRLARQDALDEVVIGTSATFLGLTVGCARCHDHKFDPVSQRDYYALQAFFAGIEYGDREMKDDKARERELELQALTPQMEKLAGELESYQPRPAVDRWIIIDDEAKARVTHLQESRGQGENPIGTQRGYRDDVGSERRSANISRGRYTWWSNVPGQDAVTWNPGSTGRFRIWLSWGVHGSGAHTRDARFVLDRDGDLQTTPDQHEIARVDQYYPVGVIDGETESKPTWSDFLDAGVHELQQASRLILRGGDSGTAITADVIVLERMPTVENKDEPRTLFPQLRGPVSSLRNAERFAPSMAKFVRFTTLETIDDNKHEPCIDELEIYSGSEFNKNLALDSRVKASASGSFPASDRHKLEHINDGKYGNGRSWISDQRGGGWVQLELPEPAMIDIVIWGRDRQGKLRDRLSVRYNLEVSVDGNEWKVVANETDRAPYGSPYGDLQALQRHANGRSPGDLNGKLKLLDQLQERKAQLEKPPTVFAAVSRQCDVTHLLNRGDAEQPLEQLGPALPAVVGSLSVSQELDDAQRRRVLADWFSQQTSPLVARVIVNRVWQNHFGVGLVETPSDFGLNGADPSHPELLDWLAGELIAHQWSLKWLERTILRSRTYQQSNRIDPAAIAIDADNRLLWRFPARRMSAEAIRDSMLQASGTLNLEMGGPGFDFFKVRGGLTGFPPLEKFSGGELRRMIYAHKIRMERVPVFGAFDCPDAGQPSPKRSESTTPAQALNLFNSEFIAEQAESFAHCLLRELKGPSAHRDVPVDRQVERAFATALGRLPDEQELSAAAEIVDRHGLAVLCRVLFNSNEFLFLP